MTADKRGISALDLSRKVSITHPTAMVLLKTLRHLMINDKQKFILEGAVEIDEFLSVQVVEQQVDPLVKPKY